MLVVGVNRSKSDMKRLQGTHITYYSYRYYWCHLNPIDFGSAYLSMGHSIEPHHRDYLSLFFKSKYK